MRLEDVSREPILNAQYIDRRWLLCATDFFTNTHTLEFYVASMAVAWGLFNLFWWMVGNLSQGAMPLQSILRELMPQWLWGLIGAAVGTGHLLTAIAQLRLRMAWLFVAFVFWSMITFMIVVHVPYNTGVIAYGGLCIVVAICYLRLYLIHEELFNLTNFFAPVLSWIQTHVRRPH